MASHDAFLAWHFSALLQYSNENHISVKQSQNQDRGKLEHIQNGTSWDELYIKHIKK